MKNALTSISLALLSMAAAAQTAPAQPAVAAPERASAAANPFTGKPLSVESVQRELELRRLQSALLEEQLRGMNLEEEARNVSVRKQAEAAVANTALARERLAQSNLERELNAAKAPPPVRPDAALRNPKKPVTKPEDEKPAVTKVAAPVRPNINVLSVLNTKGKRSAMLEIGQDVVSVEDGQNTPYGIVHVTDQGVRIDHQTLAVNDATIGRVRRSDSELQAARGPNGVGGMAPNPQAAAVAANSNQSVAQLPPLVLPPTVRAPAPAPGQGATATVGNSVTPAVTPVSIR